MSYVRMKNISDEKRIRFLNGNRLVYYCIFLVQKAMLGELQPWRSGPYSLLIARCLHISAPAWVCLVEAASPEDIRNLSATAKPLLLRFRDRFGVILLGARYTGKPLRPKPISRSFPHTSIR